MGVWEEFLDYERDRAKEAALHVASDPRVFSAIKVGPRMSVEERVEFADYYVRLCCQAMGAPSIPLIHTSSLSSKQVELACPGAAAYAMLSDGPVILINDSSKRIASDAYIKTLVNAAPHEITHAEQDRYREHPELLPKELSGDVSRILSESNKEYRSMGKIITDMMQKELTESESKKISHEDMARRAFSDYSRQPIEQHAYVFGDTFQKTLLDWVNTHDMLHNGFDKPMARGQYEAGHVNLSTLDERENSNPYLHFYFARLLGDGLESSSAPVGAHQAATLHYIKAATYGEYLIGYDAKPALEALGRLAKMGTVIGSEETPDEVRELALDAIARFSRSEIGLLAGEAKRILGDVDEHNSKHMIAGLTTAAKATFGADYSGRPVVTDLGVVPARRRKSGAMMMDVDVTTTPTGLEQTLANVGLDVQRWNKDTFRYLEQKVRDIFMMADMAEKFPGVSENTYLSMTQAEHHKGMLPIERAVELFHKVRGPGEAIEHNSKAFSPFEFSTSQEKLEHLGLAVLKARLAVDTVLRQRGHAMDLKNPYIYQKSGPLNGVKYHPVVQRHMKP